MTQRLSTMVLMCGLPGAGKTTFAMELVRRGYVRLSIDEVVWQRLGQRDAGLAMEAEAFDQLKEEVRREQRQELVELIMTGRDVVVDYGFWSRAARDDYNALFESHGCRWELVHLKADRTTLERRLEVRTARKVVTRSASSRAVSSAICDSSASTRTRTIASRASNSSSNEPIKVASSTATVETERPEHTPIRAASAHVPVSGATPRICDARHVGRPIGLRPCRWLPRLCLHIPR
ncbi:putative kinase [Streptomyces griseochromogenes]|uniref:Kinase n=1 Tax=Streptomyces griseochromogenes TaxID=68214 RepID=A0ABS4LV22_9ACTN|nr:ATP-binding protein [Streptomyces griseochromogenes]MBP2051254.1 putative kinase [Streptomyces griseochromogenes]